MKTSLKFLGGIPLIALLAACGGGNNDDEPINYTSFSDIQLEAGNLFAAYDSAAISEFGELPSGGTASYQGFVRGDLDVPDADQDEFAGQLTLTADFSNDEITEGRAYNLLREDSSGIEGELTLDSGSIKNNGGVAEVSATLSGLLDGVGSFMSLDGDFKSGSQAIEGIISGTIAGDNIDGGDFIADQ